MVGLLNQMEGSDHPMVSSTEHSTVAEQPAAALTDSSRAVEGGDGLIVKEEKLLVETCPETESTKDGSETDTANTDDPSNLDNAHEVDEDIKELKSILKRRGQYTMRKVKVDFDLIPKRIPYDETKDYTVEIQIVDKEPVKIKSWAALFAAQKAEAEAEEAAVAEAETALKKAEEVQRREALKRANKAKLVKKGGDIKSVKEELQLLKEIKTGKPLEDQKLTQDQQSNPQGDSSENKPEQGLTNQGDAKIVPVGDPEENSESSHTHTEENPNTGEPEDSASREAFDEVALSSDGAKNRSQPLHDLVPEFEHQVRILNPYAREDRSTSTAVRLHKEELQEDIAKVAASLVEDILDETPVELKAVCLNVDSDIDCTSISENLAESERGYHNSDSSFGDHNEDRTESTVEECKDISWAGSVELQHSNETVSQCTEEMPRDPLCTSNILEQKAVNVKTCPTDGNRAKVSDVVISNKLNESLKKATPEIINTAVRVLVDIEKVTLEVVTNLDAIVP